MGARLTLDHLLWRMRYAHPDSELVTAGSTQRFADAADSIEDLARTLRSRWTIGDGDTVAVLAFNTIEHFRLLFAVPLLGAAVHSLNPRVPADSLAAQALHPSPRVLLLDEAVLEHRSVGASARAAVAELERAGVPVVPVRELEPAVAGAELPVPAEDSTAFWFHTSGTTGPPRSYPVSHRDVLLHALSQASAEASGLRAADRVLALVPFCHVNGWGLPFTAALSGACMVLPGAELTAGHIAEQLRRDRITVAAAVPTVWFDVCRHLTETGEAPPPVLREVLTGGAAVSRQVVDQVRDVLGAGVASAWGMTETMAMSTYEREQPSDRTGRFAPLVEARITEGRLEVRGPFVLGDPDWFDTGDVARLDAGGRLTLLDRHKDLIKSGGEWIVSAQLEQRLCAHPAVAEAAVIARPDPKWTERPIAILVPERGHRIEEARLREHLAACFPAFWLPEEFTVVDRLPRTPVGKLDKRALRRTHTGGTA
ncbi:AMP-binding protein [Sciscionella sediminilitoris]|uniref:AMP-binding protein n=1 Tax=Sciscionella sediminilitoris TaxID=1445613 RepID=UPI0004DF61B3|nr:AMP-binding protein [Sciscionella sp. SE31]